MGIPLFVNKFIDLFFQNKKCKRFGDEVSYSFFPCFKEAPLIYSGGVGQDISFELDLANKFGARIFLFDPSPTGKETMKEIKCKKIRFIQKGIAGKTKKYYFDEPENSKEGSFRSSTNKTSKSFNCVAISDFFKEKKHLKIDLLKIDIEGFEYGVIADILKNNVPIDQICLEFHHFIKGGSYLETFRAIKNLNKAGYKLIFKEIDNYTFIRRDLL